MQINTTTAYLQNQTIAGTTQRATQSATEMIGGLQEKQAMISGQADISGRGLMLSRLFGSADKEPPVETQLTITTMGLSGRNFLTAGDRDMLSDLYAQAQHQGVNLNYVDDLASDLGTYRMFGAVQGNVNSGGMFNDAGHLQTFHFTKADTATAERILSGNEMASSALDADFLRYELDPGFSFNHRANFEFLEEVVNKFAKGAVAYGEPFDARFSTYEHQGKSNFVVELSSEVVMPPSDPDTININGVFHITETGYKNGYRMVNGEPVKSSAEKSQSVAALLEAVEVARMRAVRLFLSLETPPEDTGMLKAGTPHLDKPPI